MAEGKKKNKWLVTLIYLLAMALVGGAIGFVLSALTNGSLTDGSIFIKENFTSTFTLIGAGLGAAFVIFQSFNKLGKKKDKKPDDYSKKSQDDKQYFEGKLLSTDDIRAKYATCKFSELATTDLKKKRDHLGEPYKGAGIPIRAALGPNGKTMEVSLASPIHTMVVGNTGSGKGQSFINPTLQILAQQSTKPSLVISDSKGELYRDHSRVLRERGYKVVTFNLSKPFESERWNPFDRAYYNYMKMLHVEEGKKIHTTGTPDEFKLRHHPDARFGSTWYEFDGAAYPTEDDVKSAIKGTSQALSAAISTDVSDLCGVIVPEGDAKDRMWNDGCRDLCKAVMFAMLEDLQYPETGMSHEKLNLYNFYKIVNYRDDGDDPFHTIGKYLEGRSPLFQVKELSNTVLTAADTTKMSYLSVLGTNIGFLADPGIAYVTSGSDIDFRTFDDVSTALFLKTPDDKITMHKIASMAISQLYKDLTDIARSYPDGSLQLKRFCFFILDEFANIPKIEGMANWITISRSRNIIFVLVLQSYAQLAGKYGDKEAEIIKTNCNIQIFIGSDDDKTLKEFSDKCGMKTVKVDNNSTSESKGKEGKDASKSTSSSFSYQQRPLVFPEELRMLPKGNAYFLLSKTPPFRSTMTESYKCGSVYHMQSAAEEFRPAKYLDVDKITYSMNTYINMRRGNRQLNNLDGMKMGSPFEDDDDEDEF